MTIMSETRKLKLNKTQKQAMPQVYNTHDFVTHDCTPDMYYSKYLLSGY